MALRVEPLPRPAPLLTPQALCLQLSICYRSYSRLVRAGLPCVWVLTARRYDLGEVTAWLRARAATPVAPTRARATLHARPDESQLVRHLKMLARAGGAR